jgi:hypothetical protein
MTRSLFRFVEDPFFNGVAHRLGSQGIAIVELDIVANFKFPDAVTDGFPGRGHVREDFPGIGMPKYQGVPDQVAHLEHLTRRGLIGLHGEELGVKRDIH